MQILQSPQEDMSMALIGSIVAQLVLGRRQDRQMAVLVEERAPRAVTSPAG